MGFSSSGSYITAAQGRSNTANTADSSSISLSTDTIDFALSGDTDTTSASNYLSLFSVLNANILDSRNLAGLGSAIDTYTKSLANFNV